ncbi:MAG: esterase [Candidatus Thiodiazotropha sp. (ex Myrtea spinifera)]|nr:esterase [Candidatus Thiodiazotropha sp. (ex Myrtea spinifera)]MCU7828744.1 esterase [Candidatus Thiodiazotropha sp. (ex Myrtea sp. 'scaly one' KF741663)]
MNLSRRFHIFLLFTALLLGGCAKHQLYRSELTICEGVDTEQTCAQHAMARESSAGQAEDDYLLAFIEFDDQGQLFSREQMRAVTDELNRMTASDDLLMVVFVHGWKHSAAPNDSNIHTFRETLRRLSLLESNMSRLQNRKPRRVAGIYLGWRGGSLTLPVLKELTFWERKNTAHKVGRGALTEVLNHLELIRNTRNHLVSDEAHRAETRLVVVGHSFGGAVVYSSLSQILMSRFVDTLGPVSVVSDVVGFGDLVVLINPAFEAARFSSLSDMANERSSYFESQLPVMAILTSEADGATKYAFPMGRGLSTLFETYRATDRANPVNDAQVKIDQREANIQAVGHYRPYRTHTLKAEGPTSPALPTIEDTLSQFRTVSQGWEDDAPGSRINFDGSVLERSLDSVGKNPYLVIQVDEALIGGHNEIDDPRIASFVRQLILLSSQQADPDVRRQLRALLPPAQ